MDNNCSEVVSEVTLKDLRFSRQLAGAEDLKFGFNSVTQIRNGQVVIVSDINADTIPYDTDTSIKVKIEQILAKYPV